MIHSSSAYNCYFYFRPRFLFVVLPYFSHPIHIHFIVFFFSLLSYLPISIACSQNSRGWMWPRFYTQTANVLWWNANIKWLMNHRSIYMCVCMFFCVQQSIAQVLKSIHYRRTYKNYFNTIFQLFRCDCHTI